MRLDVFFDNNSNNKVVIKFNNLKRVIINLVCELDAFAPILMENSMMIV